MLSAAYYALSLKSDVILYTRYHSKTVRYGYEKSDGSDTKQ